MTNFPQPIRVSPGCTRWRLSELEQYERESLGADIPPRAAADEKYLTARQVAARYGVHEKTPWYWAAKSGRAA